MRPYAGAKTGGHGLGGLTPVRSRRAGGRATGACGSLGALLAAERHDVAGLGMGSEDKSQPRLLEAGKLRPSAIGRCAWDGAHNSDVLTISADGRTLFVGSTKARIFRSLVPASLGTRAHAT